MGTLEEITPESYLEWVNNQHQQIIKELENQRSESHQLIAYRAPERITAAWGTPVTLRGIAPFQVTTDLFSEAETNIELPTKQPLFEAYPLDLNIVQSNHFATIWFSSEDVLDFFEIEPTNNRVVSRSPRIVANKPQGIYEIRISLRHD